MRLSFKKKEVELLCTLLSDTVKRVRLLEARAEIMGLFSLDPEERQFLTAYSTVGVFDLQVKIERDLK